MPSSSRPGRAPLRRADLGVVVAALVTLGARPAPVGAQDLSWSTTVDAAGDGIYLAFTEPAVRFGRENGFSPVVSLGAYVARVEGDNSLGLAPAIALRYLGSSGSVQGKIGWGRSSSTTVGAGAPTMTMMSRTAPPIGRATALSPETAAARASQAVGGDGGHLNASLQAELAGDGAWDLQGIASYSWGSDVVWSRARVARVVSMSASGGSIALGAEAVWQAQRDDGDLVHGDEYRASFFGPVVRFARAGGSVMGLSGGLKRVEPVASRTWYVKLELTIDP